MVLMELEYRSHTIKHHRMHPPKEDQPLKRMGRQISVHCSIDDSARDNSIRISHDQTCADLKVSSPAVSIFHLCN
jgi:hypothetical protein